jgi:archaellum component FlaC
MNNQDPRWWKFWQNLAWFVATLVALVILQRFLRTPFILMALWVVGIAWGGLLAYKLSRLLFGSDQIVVSEERSRAYLEQARAYRAKIGRAIKSATNATAQERLERIQGQIETLTEAIEAIAARISQLREDDVIRRDLQAVPKAIKELEARLAAETDEATRRQLERTLANRRQQLESLEGLQTSIKQAEIQVESTLSQLGTIYSQLLTGQSTSQVADYGRLAAGIDEEVELLQDRLEALREVKLGGI